MSIFIKIDNMRLFQRENGYWYVEFARGKKKSLGTKDKKLAERLFKELQKEALKGKLILLEKNDKITFQEFLDEYLAWSQATKAHTTARRDKYALKNFISFIGNIPLRLINQKKIEDYIVYLRQKNYTVTSINIELRHLKSAFSRAKDWGYIKENPFSKIKPLREEQKPPAFISPEEMQHIMEYLRDKDQTFYRVVFFTLETGARRTEVFQVRWEDIDFERKVIILSGKGKKKRIVPLSSRLEKVLSEIKKERGKVFPYESIDTITHKWHKTMRALNLKYRFHDIRHTTASI